MKDNKEAGEMAGSRIVLEKNSMGSPRGDGGR